MWRLLKYTRYFLLCPLRRIMALAVVVVSPLIQPGNMRHGENVSLDSQDANLESWATTGSRSNVTKSR